MYVLFGLGFEKKKVFLKYDIKNRNEKKKKNLCTSIVQI